MNTKSFAAFNKSSEIRESSSSGGVFYAIAKNILANDGLVFGAAFDNEWQVYHKSCEEIEELPLLMQSKYVQSSVGNVFNEVKVALQSNREVCFCGTPCQVQGLISYLHATLGSEDCVKKLVTIDFICHGVPSRLVWRKYLEEVTRNRKVANVNFRDKEYGWDNFSLSITFEDGSRFVETKKKNAFLKGFLQNLYLRESCYGCKFKGFDRASDFTLADFWGVEKELPDYYDNKGTSVIIVHNEKAAKMLEGMKSDIAFCEIDNCIVERTNPAVIKSVRLSKKRHSFMNKIKTNRIISLINRYTRISIAKRISRKLIRMTTIMEDLD